MPKCHFRGHPSPTTIIISIASVFGDVAVLNVPDASAVAVVNMHSATGVSTGSGASVIVRAPCCSSCTCAAVGPAVNVFLPLLFLSGSQLCSVPDP